MLMNLKEENLKEEIKNGIVVVDFYATWCGPCKMLGPVIEEVASTLTDVKFIKVDVDEFSDLAKNYAVMSVPTIYFFKNGEVISKNIGYVPKEVLVEKILEIKNN